MYACIRQLPALYAQQRHTVKEKLLSLSPADGCIDGHDAVEQASQHKPD
jgi:hypothetical protein